MKKGIVYGLGLTYLALTWAAMAWLGEHQREQVESRVYEVARACYPGSPIDNQQRDIFAKDLFDTHSITYVSGGSAINRANNNNVSQSRLYDILQEKENSCKKRNKLD